MEHQHCQDSTHTCPFSVTALSAPFVVDGSLEQWPCRKWTVDALARTLGNRSFRCRLTHRERVHKGDPAWEAESVYVDCRLHQFNAWCHGEAGEDNPLALFSPDVFSGYIDYKYMSHVFAEHPDMLKEVEWSSLGLEGIDGKDSTLWIGSAGASTPCHYDTYGFNLVAQIQGRKRWVLFPPEESCSMYPTRIPYEESSVFSQVDLSSPDVSRFPRFKKIRPVVIILEPGQVLYVPRHWWHYVTCTQMAISINTWVQMPEDADSRVHEAVTRTLASSLIPYLTHTVSADQEDDWVNPTEELEAAACNMQYLKAALSSVSPSHTAGLRETSPSPHHQSHAHQHCSPPTHLSPAEGTQKLASSGTVTSGPNCVGDDSSEKLEQLSCKRRDQKTEKQKSSDMLRMNQNVATEGASENLEHFPYKSESLEKSLMVLADAADANRDVPSGRCADCECSVGPRETDVCAGDDFNVCARLGQVARSLQGRRVHMVDSPFSLSEFLEDRLQSGWSSFPQHCDSSVTETERQNISVSLKRKHAGDKCSNKLVGESDQSTRLMSTGTHHDVTMNEPGSTPPECKKLCLRESREVSYRSVSHHENKCEKDIENTAQPFCRCSKSQGSQDVSIYVPRPCSLESYIKLLQQRCTQKLALECVEEDEMENDSEGGSTASKEETSNQSPGLEEVLLKSILHPDVVSLIVSKLKEHIR